MDGENRRLFSVKRLPEGGSLKKTVGGHGDQIRYLNEEDSFYYIAILRVNVGGTAGETPLVPVLTGTRGLFFY